MYSTLVQSLRRLYQKKSPVVTEEKLQTMLEDGTITKEEYDYIVS